MPARRPKRPKLPRELFETRTHAWQSLGLGEEIETRKDSKSTMVGFVVAVLALVGTLVLYSHRRQIAPGYGEWFRIGTVIVLIIVGSAAISLLLRSVQPRLYRRLDPATAGTTGFVFRLLASLAVVVVALRIAGVNAGTLAVGGAFTAVLLGLAAQQSLGAIFAGIVLQTTRPFRVGERVRFVGGAMAGSVEGTVTSLGLFYTTLSQGADRLQIPNQVLLSLAVVPLREPEKVDVRVHFPRHVGPRDVEEQLLRTITVPTRYRPSVSLEEVEADGVVMRINATPLRSEDGSQLAEEVLEALHRRDTAEHRAAAETTPLPD
ncbi:MAG TPA: mechanosensitive ion channel domain-containing protein [Solirubrobacterales bacterium]|nr:mechanosensitive ion channel domain-containing protein [Solirubrobacterales bacterium]